MFQEWIQNMVVFLLLMTMLKHLIPSEKYQKYVRLTLGLILIFIILTPITRLLGLDDKIFQNYIRESLDISALDAKISGQTFDAQTRYHESYTAMLCEMIEAYFEENSMNVSYCEIEMNKDMDSESYGEIYKICVGIYPKDVLVENDRENTAVQVEKIRVGSEKKAKAEEIVIPEQKWSTWREDLANQFGVDGENVELEICL